MTVHRSAEELASFATSALEAVDVPPADAALVADSLVCAELWGHHSHGLLRLPWYVNRLRSGVMQARTDAELVVDVDAVAVIDGHDGIGQVLAATAAEQAVVRAKRHGIAAVGVRNSNHFGTAAYFTRMAPPRGCIGVLTTNSSPAIAPWGGRTARLGSNPWSVAVPAGDGRVCVIDVSNSVVARGKVYVARQDGHSIPLGWALDQKGRPTTDPEAALAGVLLPMAAHKGYVIAVMMDVLSGVLTGSGYGSAVAGPYQSERRSRAGHLYIALDIEAFGPPGQFVAGVDDLLAELAATPVAADASEILYPGELEARAEAKARAEGIVLTDAAAAVLRTLGGELDLPWAADSDS